MTTLIDLTVIASRTMCASLTHAVCSFFRPLRTRLIARALVYTAFAFSSSVASAEEVEVKQTAWVGSQRIYIPRLGQVRISFPATSPNAGGGLKVARASATIPGSGEHATTSFSVNSHTGRRELLVNARNPRSGNLVFARVSAKSNAARMRASGVPASVLAGVGCATRTAASSSTQRRSYSRSGNGSHGEGSDGNRAAAISVQSSPALKVAFVADRPYSRRFGLGTEQYLVTMLDQVNLVYQRDLGLTVTPVLLAREKVVSSALSPNRSGTLLDGFAVLANRNRYGEANVYHLLTGKDLTDNIIGLANLPGACATTKGLRVSLSQYLNPAVDYMTVAHELGHNLGADHDSITQPDTLMFPSLPVDSVRFSLRSKNQINAFLEYSDIQECLTEQPRAESNLGFSFSVGTHGELGTTVSLPVLDRSCRVQIDASFSSNFRSFRSAVLNSSDSLSLRVFSKVGVRPSTGQRLYLRATAQCGDSRSVATTSKSVRHLSRRLPVASNGVWLSRAMSAIQ